MRKATHWLLGSMLLLLVPFIALSAEEADPAQAQQAAGEEQAGESAFYSPWQADEPAEPAGEAVTPEAEQTQSGEGLQSGTEESAAEPSASPEEEVPTEDPAVSANDSDTASPDSDSAEHGESPAEVDTGILLAQDETEPDAVEVSNADCHCSGGTICGCGKCSSCCGCRGEDCGTLEFFGPMAVINQHPPALMTLQPEPDVATVLPDGESFMRFKLDITNVFIRELDSGTIADYDYEEMRTTLDYTTRLGEGEISAELPFSYRSGGFTDSIIDGWHEFFGLQRGIRIGYPTNSFRYVIATREGEVYNGTEGFGLGDLSLTYKHPISDNGRGDAFALRTAVKLPTGDPNKATGSGNFDYSVGALWQTQIAPRWRGYVNADYIFVGEPDWENIGWQDSVQTIWGIEYALKRNTTLTALYRTHRNPLRIGGREADKNSQTLGLGFNHRINEDLVFTGGFDEDINPETAPDFIAVMHLKWEF